MAKPNAETTYSPTVAEYSSISKSIADLLESSCWNRLNITGVNKVSKKGYKDPFFTVSLSFSDSAIAYPKFIILKDNFRFMSINPSRDIVQNGDTLRDSTEIAILIKMTRELIKMKTDSIEIPKYFVKNRDGYYGLCWPVVSIDPAAPYPIIDPYVIYFNQSKCIVGFH